MRRKVYSRVCWPFALACLISIPSTPLIRAASDDASPPPQPAPLELDDPALPLQPRTLRSESDEDRLAAMSLFGAARMREQQDDRHGALRFYQRALRRDPASLTVLREIVPLSFDLGRSDEAMRYAVKVAELDPSDGLLLRRLGLHLTSRGDFEQALQLYERAVAVETADQQEAESIILLSQMAKLYFVINHLDQAADATQQVLAALEKQDNPALDNNQRTAILEDAARGYEALGVAVGGKNSEEAMAYCFYGELLLAANRTADARRAFEHAEQIDPQEARRHLLDSLLLEAEEKPAEALASLEAYFATQQVAQGRDPYELLGRLLTTLDRQNELLDRLAALRLQMPENAPLGYELADRYRAAGQLDDARQLYAELLEDGPTIDAYRGLVDIYRQTGDSEALLDILSDSLAQLRSLDLLGEEAEQLSSDQAVVEALFKVARGRAAAEQPFFDYDTALATAAVALQAESYAVAGEFFEHAQNVQPSSKLDVLRQWGLGLLFDEQYADAAEVLRRAANAAETPEQKADFLYHLAGALAMNKQPDDAIDTARRAAELAEANREQLGDAFFRIASRPPWIMYHAQRYADATQAYLALIERFDHSETSPAARRALRDARLILSNIEVQQQSLPQAEEWLEQILDEYPDDVSALNDLGYLWVDQGKHLQRSLRMIEHALAAEPDNAAYRDSLGWAYYKLGRYDEAAAQLEQAVDNSEPDATILDHLGDAYLKLHRPADAIQTWQRAIDRFDADVHALQIEATRQKLAQLQAATSPPNDQPPTN